MAEVNREHFCISLWRGYTVHFLAILVSFRSVIFNIEFVNRNWLTNDQTSTPSAFVPLNYVEPCVYQSRVTLIVTFLSQVFSAVSTFPWAKVCGLSPRLYVLYELSSELWANVRVLPGKGVAGCNVCSMFHWFIKLGPGDDSAAVFP